MQLQLNHGERSVICGNFTKTVLASTKPLVLFIEDLHWADSASLSLLHHLSRIISSERILILATYRSDEVTEMVEDHLNPLTDTLRLMSREDLFREIKLPSLNKANVKEATQLIEAGY